MTSLSGSNTLGSIHLDKQGGIAASSTMTQKAMTAGIEWSYRIPDPLDQDQ
jgi:hypothetical protein